MTDATPSVITYNTTHPTGVFDYVCSRCGRHEAERFTCCGTVAWHDDVLAIRGVLLNDPKAIDQLCKLGVLERTQDNDGNPEIFTRLGADVHYAWAGMWQNRQRMDRQHYEAMTVAGWHEYRLNEQDLRIKELESEISDLKARLV